MKLKNIVSHYNIDRNLKILKNGIMDIFLENITIYNPWSILNYIDNHEAGFMPYWINSSSNDLVKVILSKSESEVKNDLEH